MKGLLLCLVSVLTLLDGLHAISDRIWTIAIGDDWGSHEYRTETGALGGFGHDFIDAVCREGLMDCRIVYAPYDECYVTEPGGHPYGGRGLFADWFDSCATWVPTVERLHTFTFTNSYMEKDPTYFYFKKGTTFDYTDLKNKKIGFIIGWAASAQCIARQTDIANNVLDIVQTVYRATVAELYAALEAEDIDAILISEHAWHPDQLANLDKTPKKNVQCLIDGTALMCRKDSDFPATWNVAFRKFTQTTRWLQLCIDSNLRHSTRGQPIDCKDV